MQFLMYTTDQGPQAGAPPSAEKMAEIGKFMAEAVQAGVVVTTGGLQPTGTRIRLSGGTDLLGHWIAGEGQDV